MTFRKLKNAKEAVFPTSHEVGLSKRELIAAMAMQGIMGKIYGHVDGSEDPEIHARFALKYADALIKELLNDVP